MATNQEPGLPGETRAIVYDRNSEARTRVSTLLASDSDGAQSVQVWSPDERLLRRCVIKYALHEFVHCGVGGTGVILLLFFLVFSQLLGLPDWSKESVALIVVMCAVVGIGYAWFFAWKSACEIATSVNLRRLHYIATDSVGMAITMMDGACTLRWCDIVSLVRGLVPLLPYVRLRLIDSSEIYVDFYGYPRDQVESIIALIARRSELVGSSDGGSFDRVPCPVLGEPSEPSSLS